MPSDDPSVERVWHYMGSCPGCGKAIAKDSNGIRCVGCGETFPPEVFEDG